MSPLGAPRSGPRPARARGQGDPETTLPAPAASPRLTTTPWGAVKTRLQPTRLEEGDICRGRAGADGRRGAYRRCWAGPRGAWAGPSTLVAAPGQPGDDWDDDVAAAVTSDVYAFPREQE